MNVLILSNGDSVYGAPRAAFRLHEALGQGGGVESRMLVMDKRSDVNTVITPYKGKIDKLWGKMIAWHLDRLPLWKYRHIANNKYGDVSPAWVRNRKLAGAINSINPDIVHLHWICGGMIAIEDLALIKAPIVWTLHDMWAFTGGCHYAATEKDPSPQSGGMPLCGEQHQLCEKYTAQCGKCGVLGSDKVKDLSYVILKRKKKTFAKIGRMTIVGVSRWMADCAQKSAVFSSRKVVCLPNAINTNVFKPIGKQQARMQWNLPADKKLVLFGAVKATSTPYKGYDLLIEALNKITTGNVEFVVFGASEPNDPPKLPHAARYVGHLSDDVSLAALYSACDVMVVPSRREAFGQTASEAMACGTPAVAFEVGGLPDIIEHKANGYLARPFDTDDLAKGIDWVLNNENYGELCENASQKVVREFDYDVVAKKYSQLYEEALR